MNHLIEKSMRLRIEMAALAQNPKIYMQDLPNEEIEALVFNCEELHDSLEEEKKRRAEKS